MIIPTVLESTSKGDRAYDLYSRLLRDRIIMLGTAIDDNVANIVVAQLLFLDQEDCKRPIQLYINSPGGVVTAGMGIHDTMQFIKSEVHVTCIGQAASMGAFLLSAGEKGHRYSLPHSRIMIHQPSGGAQGQASDIQIQAKEIQRMKGMLNAIIAKNCGKTAKEVEAASDRDNHMTAEEAKEFGLIDHVIERKGAAL